MQVGVLIKYQKQRIASPPNAAFCLAQSLLMPCKYQRMVAKAGWTPLGFGYETSTGCGCGIHFLQVKQVIFLFFLPHIVLASKWHIHL